MAYLNCVEVDPVTGRPVGAPVETFVWPEKVLFIHAQGERTRIVLAGGASKAADLLAVENVHHVARLLRECRYGRPVDDEDRDPHTVLCSECGQAPRASGSAKCDHCGPQEEGGALAVRN